MKKQHPNAGRGNGNAKLDDEIFDDIFLTEKVIKYKLSSREVAKKHGVSHATVCNARNGKTYKQEKK